MNRQSIIFITSLVISTNLLYSQRITITNDSLRVHFRQETASNVLTYYQKIFYGGDINFNYKNLYYDTAIKDSLLRWLDEDILVNYEIDQHKQHITEYLNKKTFTESYVSHNNNLNFDSIYSNPELYESYYELAISAAVDRYKDGILKRKKELLPPYEVLYLHSKIAYPEAYKKIKQWWYMEGMEKTIIYRCMLRMNDPEAQAMLDKTVNEAVKSNGKTINNFSIINELKFIANSNAIKNLLKMLPIKKKVLVISGEPLEPLDLYTFNALLELLERHNIKGDFIPFSKSTDFSNISEELKYLRNHRIAIEEGSNRLIKKLESEEQYWMENMPFDYVPDISNNN